MAKRTLDSFFSPPTKKTKQSNEQYEANTTLSHHQLGSDLAPILKSIKSTSHATYAFPIADLPDNIAEEIEEILLTAKGKAIDDQPHLNLLSFEPLIPKPTADELFNFLRSSLPFYRVKYTLTRFGKTFDMNTPRFTTVYGIDETSRFVVTPNSQTTEADGTTVTRTTTRIVDSSDTSRESPPAKYKKCTVSPRPVPPCLMMLKNLTEAVTSETYNIVLVNYYASGADSISYHSDDEYFLGDHPAIASFSLGARRDFLLKHKAPGAGPGNGNKANAPKGQDAIYPGTSLLKLPLASGDMILMRGDTQRNWLHSIPKRSGKGIEADKGRINITMRKAMIPAGTENYYQYNVGTGPVYRWDERTKEMRIWTNPKLETPTSVMAMPHPVLGAVPFAVVQDLKGKSKEEVEQRLIDYFGEDSSLGGVATLKDLGLDKFPLNKTEKIVKRKLAEYVAQYLVKTGGLKWKAVSATC